MILGKRLCEGDEAAQRDDPHQDNLLRIRSAGRALGDRSDEITHTSQVVIDMGSPGILAVTPVAVGMFWDKTFSRTDRFKVRWLDWTECVEVGWLQQGTGARLGITPLHKSLGAWKLRPTIVAKQQPLFQPAAEAAISAWRAARG